MQLSIWIKQQLIEENYLSDEQNLLDPSKATSDQNFNTVCNESDTRAPGQNNARIVNRAIIEADKVKY